MQLCLIDFTIFLAIKPEIIDKLQAVKKEQIEATQKKEKEAKEKKAADEKKTTNTGVTTSNSTPIPNTLTSVDTSGGQVATETERLQSELRNLTRNARALASNVEVCTQYHILYLKKDNKCYRTYWPHIMCFKKPGVSDM